MRPLLVLLHRCLGLALAGFLAVAGLSGALLAVTGVIIGWRKRWARAKSARRHLLDEVPDRE